MVTTRFVTQTLLLLLLGVWVQAIESPSTASAAVDRAQTKNVHTDRAPYNPGPPPDIEPARDEDHRQQQADDADWDIELDEPGPDDHVSVSDLVNGTDFTEDEDIPECIADCVLDIEACDSATAEKLTCECAREASTKCNPEKHCDVPVLVQLDHMKSRVCGLSLKDPEIKALRDHGRKGPPSNQTSVPQLADDSNFHPEGPLATHDKPKQEAGPGQHKQSLFDARQGHTSATHVEDVLVVPAVCNKDTQCRDGHVCSDGSCVPKSQLSKQIKASSNKQPPATNKQPPATNKQPPAANKPPATTLPAPPPKNQSGEEGRQESQEYKKKLESLGASLQEQERTIASMTHSLLTLGGAVSPPQGTKLGTKREVQDKYIKDALQQYTLKQCSKEALAPPLKPPVPTSTPSQQATDKHLITEHELLKTNVKALMLQMQQSDGASMRAEAWKSSEMWDRLHRAVKHGGGIIAASWSKFIEQLTQRNEVAPAGMDDPVAIGMTYGIATSPALVMLCLSRFQMIKDFFILQGIFFNCMMSGIFGLLAMLSAYCGFNPLKIVIGQESGLPEFELIFMCVYVYIAACNLFLLFLQRGAAEKLHAFFSLVLGAHLYWMLYTLRSEDSGLQHIFYGVYFVCFTGCSIAKLRGVAVLHLTGAVKRSLKTRKGGKTAIPVKDEEKGAVFELGDDTETVGLVG